MYVQLSFVHLDFGHWKLFRISDFVLGHYSSSRLMVGGRADPTQGGGFCRAAVPAAGLWSAGAALYRTG
jgi:hypothetical protein